MIFHFIVSISSSFIDFLPPPYLRVLAALSRIFMAFHLLHCLRAWTSQRFSIDFERRRHLPSDFETTLRVQVHGFL